MSDKQILPSDITAFWLNAGKDKWFVKDDSFDQLIVENYQPLWQKALAGRLASWCDSDEGLLALTIVLDQFPRNMFRQDVRAFCSDKDARKVATKALEKNVDQRVDPQLRPFLYLPFEHSENLDDQKKSMQLFTALGDERLLHFAQVHYDIINQFGRFPHRNAVLGRTTTREEKAFLDAGGFTG